VEVFRFVRFISVLAIVTGILFYAIAVGRGGDPLQMFITCFVVRVWGSSAHASLLRCSTARLLSC
jgi:hypothetical protein